MHVANDDHADLSASITDCAVRLHPMPRYHQCAAMRMLVTLLQQQQTNGLSDCSCLIALAAQDVVHLVMTLLPGATSAAGHTM